MKTVIQQSIESKTASYAMQELSAVEKNTILLAMADALIEDIEGIIRINKCDLDAAKEKNMTQAFIDRLTLTPQRIEGMAHGLRVIANAENPVGQVIHGWTSEEGLEISKVRVPLGVIGMIYESRPNVTVDAAGLAIKAGNTILLRGGSNAHATNNYLTNLIVNAGYRHGLPQNAIAYLENPKRDAIIELVSCDTTVDVVIPRGGTSLKETVIEHAKVPVIVTGAGLCHTYIDQDTHGIDAKAIVLNAKTQRTGVCNATETLLIHREHDSEAINVLFNALLDAGVTLIGCQGCVSYNDAVQLATDETYCCEHLSMTLSVKIVDSLDDAIDHINTHGTRHSEAIITSNYAASERFLNRVDASTVYVNASTRFTDGSVFGFGGEIGISTQKLHARGPMGLEALTTTKYKVRGQGQTR